MNYVYILRNKNTGRLYKGFTKNLKRRINEHRSRNVTTTRKSGRWNLVYYQAFVSEKDARSEEKFLKSGKGKERIKFLLQDTLTIK